jgi:hypothetical protein
LIEGDANVALGSEVVDFIWLQIEDKVRQGLSVGEITVVQEQFWVFVNISVEMIDSSGGEA